ncbi:MAG: hypothetical protein ACR2LY_07285 [Thermoleophilaceae bacterium]
MSLALTERGISLALEPLSLAAGRWQAVVLPALVGLGFLVLVAIAGDGDEPGERTFQLVLAVAFTVFFVLAGVACTALGVVVRRFVLPRLWSGDTNGHR